MRTAEVVLLPALLAASLATGAQTEQRNRGNTKRQPHEHAQTGRGLLHNHPCFETRGILARSPFGATDAAATATSWRKMRCGKNAHRLHGKFSWRLFMQSTHRTQ